MAAATARVWVSSARPKRQPSPGLSMRSPAKGYRQTTVETICFHVFFFFFFLSFILSFFPFFITYK
jgi:hypothetical protein